ncbi:MAG TPA: histidine kinase, partial [Virgibacillus sp.]|nr:histidine kinase [Virgibacillus sp.]
MKYLHLNNISLKNKLLLVYFISVFIPIVLTNITFYYVTTENVKKQKQRDLSLAVEQMANDFERGIEDAVGVSNVLYTDNVLYTFLENDYETLSDFVQAYNTDFRDINRYVPIYSAVHSISVYTNNETVIYAGGIHPINEEVKNSDWYKNTNVSRSIFPVVTRKRSDTGGLDTFNVVRELNYYNHNTAQKILNIELNTTFIDHIFNNVTFPGDVYLVNGDGAIEYTTNSTIHWSEQMYQFDSISIPNDSIVFEEQYKQRYLKDWQVIGVTSESSLVDEVQSSRNFMIYLVIGNFVLPSIIIIYISGSLHNRLSRIVKHMRKVEDQNFDPIEDSNFRDEIGELTSAFNRMSKKIKELINDVYISHIRKKDLELQRKQSQINALQSQINPHFLFNVLETIRMRSILKKEDETAEIIEDMAKLLRNSINWGKDWVTVKEEVELIQSFLEIQQYRFG